MYNMEKDKLCRRHHKNPSFSSTLLDEIYRSIDGYDQRREDFKLPKLETRKQSCISIAPKAKKKSIEDEEIASLRRACLIEKWMDKKVGKGLSHELDNDSLFFSSTSSESNSGTLSASSSEPDYSFYSEKSSSSSTTCFAAPRTKSVRRASVSPRRPTQLYSFDNQQASKNEDTNLIKSKSRALKMYNNLKKVKQPISPGGRLTSFLTSIFNSKSKNLKDPNGGFHEVDDRNSKSSTFSRSCLSKTQTPPKFSQNGVKRTVTFNPVSVIVDEDCRPCGHKSIYDQDSHDIRRPKSQGNAEKNRTKVDSLKSYKNDYINVDYADEDDDDASSCSSSDLFEIDHLAFFGNKRFCEELPVYETTHVDTNRGIASGFIH